MNIRSNFFSADWTLYTFIQLVRKLLSRSWENQLLNSFTGPGNDVCPKKCLKYCLSVEFWFFRLLLFCSIIFGRNWFFFTVCFTVRLSVETSDWSIFVFHKQSKSHIPKSTDFYLFLIIIFLMETLCSLKSTLECNFPSRRQHKNGI